MKILQLVTKRQYRGAEVFAANLSSELIEFGHEIIFAGLYQQEDDVLEVEGALNIDLCSKKPVVFSFRLVRNMVALLKSEKPDVVQCNGSDTLKYMVAASFFTSEIPITYRNISIISEWIDGSLKLNVYKFLFKKVAHVTSVGSESLQDLINTLNYPEKKASVIRRGIPISPVPSDSNTKNLKTELNLNSDDKIVMHIGNFSPEKNHEFLIDVFSEIKKDHPEIKLILVGTGITFESIKKRIQQKNLVNTVFLLGFRKDIPELLSQADCFALASKIEGVPGVILEAASQGVPSVATNVGGVREVLKDGETGFIIDNFDKVKYRERLISLVSDKDLNLRMGTKAFDLVQKDFDPFENAKKFEKLYEQLENKSGGKFEHLRVLQIIQKKQFRGAEVFASQLSNHLEKSGNTVKMVCIYGGDAQLPFLGEIESLNRRKYNRAFDPFGWRKLADIIQRFKPDVVQANAADTLKYAVFSKLAFGWHVPVIYRNASTPSFYIKNSFTRYINAFLLKNVDAIASVSEASMKDLNNLFPFTQSKSFVIPVGVEKNTSIEEMDPFSASEKNKVFNLIHIGSFTREKNHIGLLRIFKRILEQEKNIILNLVGEGPLFSKIVDQTVQLRIEHHVNFLGEVKDPKNYLEHNHVLLLPSLVEGLPAVILEAMYYKIPVVAYNVGGISEVISNDVTGKLIEHGDEVAFADAVRHLRYDVDLRKSIIENAFTLISSDFINSDIKESFLDSYVKLLRNKN